MMQLRAYHSLGGFDHGWLNTKHHFSFGQYFDSTRMGWGALRVINDDTIAPKSGFPPHPHKDMEIVTLVLQGAISHKDSLGNVGRTAAQEVQVMTAGTGIHHEEWNQEEVVTKLLQIWIQPRTLGLEPRWTSRALTPHLAVDTFVTLASGSERGENILQLNADASIRWAHLQEGFDLYYTALNSRRVYVLLVAGQVHVNGELMHAGDGMAVKDEKLLFCASEASKILLIDATA